MQRAKDLSRPYVARKDVIGIYVVGSATRPQRDELSDYDIEVILDDAAYAQTPDAERQVFVYRDGEPKVVDYEFYLRPWSEFLALVSSTQDLFHYPYQHAVIVHDPVGRIAPVIRRLAELPEGIRQDRLRAHYLEFRFALGRARKTAQGGRNRDLNLRLLRGDAASALVKVLFLAARSWPATHHWVEQELRLLGVPAALVQDMEATFRDPAHERTKRLVETVDAWLNERGETFHHDTSALIAWAFHRDEGKSAFERWAGR
ncbi:MAG: hypothetical protein PHU43_00845 [Candidatus Bipolaricaulis sp.]|nr:hypothetical protein [Candidatus Bipolaricaulis sp.]